ncbi:MAG TPA: hypothetical protein ENI05_08900 [Porticoccus sp.]|nr:hypothetical protein [Porticoccus sp.]
MTVYIAASWKYYHTVEMLTDLIDAKGHTVWSFVRNNFEEFNQNGHSNFEDWINSENADKAFMYDVGSATKADLVIYIGPSGTDAWAEVGAAYGKGKGKIFGITGSKGEQVGLMRKMVTWFGTHYELLDAIDALAAGVYKIGYRHPP